MKSCRIMGLDPGLRNTGWGVIDCLDNRIKHVAHGRISPSPDGELSARLVILHKELTTLIQKHKPDEAALEETFVNVNPTSALKLGQARGVILATPALLGVKVAEYAPNKIKKSVVGAGHASKEQVMVMMRHLLPGAGELTPDAADALAVAICHAHYRATLNRWEAT